MTIRCGDDEKRRQAWFDGHRNRLEQVAYPTGGFGCPWAPQHAEWHPGEDQPWPVYFRGAYIGRT